MKGGEEGREKLDNLVIVLKPPTTCRTQDSTSTVTLTLHLTSPSSPCTPHPSSVTPTPPHSSTCTPHPVSLTPHPSSVTSTPLTPHPAPLTLYPSPLTLHLSPPHPSLLTLHPSPCIPHPSPFISHSSHLTHYSLRHKQNAPQFSEPTVRGTLQSDWPVDGQQCLMNLATLGH